MGATEVTQGQWKKVMGNNPSMFPDCGDDCPVDSVSWGEAVDFCNAVSAREKRSVCYDRFGVWDLSCTGYRLPTEAEWEFAARAGTTTAFNTGDRLSVDQANYDGRFSPAGSPDEGQARLRPVAVGSFPPNGWGLYDMHGNVAEWVWDRWAGYLPGAVADPIGPNLRGVEPINYGGVGIGGKTGKPDFDWCQERSSASARRAINPYGDFFRVVRGGGWSSTASNCRSAARSYYSAEDSRADVGFRLARSLP